MALDAMLHFLGSRLVLMRSRTSRFAPPIMVATNAGNPERSTVLEVWGYLADSVLFRRRVRWRWTAALS
jgi:hypothetical protein